MNKIIVFLTCSIMMLLCACETETKYYVKEVDLEKYVHSFTSFVEWSTEKHEYESALRSVDFAKFNPELFQLNFKQRELKQAKENYKDVLEKKCEDISSIIRDAKILEGREDTVFCKDFSLGIPIVFHYEITEIKIKNLEYAVKQLNRFEEELKEVNK